MGGAVAALGALAMIADGAGNRAQPRVVETPGAVTRVLVQHRTTRVVRHRRLPARRVAVTHHAAQRRVMVRAQPPSAAREPSRHRLTIVARSRTTMPIATTAFRFVPRAVPSRTRLPRITPRWMPATFGPAPAPVRRATPTVRRMTPGTPGPTTAPTRRDDD
jgi:hypothetical protein